MNAPQSSNQKLCDALALAHSYLYDALTYNDVVNGRHNRINLAMQEIGTVMDALRVTDETPGEPDEPFRGSWNCKARRTADPPQDCDWPHCGCDDHASKVRLAALWL